MREGDVVIDGINYGQLIEIELEAGVWGVVDDFRKDLVKHINSRPYGGSLFLPVWVSIQHAVAQTTVWACAREELEALARAVSRQYPDVRVEGSARIFQFYKNGEPFGERKKYSDFYICSPEEDAKYAW